jgi:hypothetical protein
MTKLKDAIHERFIGGPTSTRIASWAAVIVIILMVGQILWVNWPNP